MICRADYTREPIAEGMPGDFESHFEAPRYRGGSRLNADTLVHVDYIGRANGASYVKVYAVDLARVGYKGANGYGVNTTSWQRLVYEGPIT